MLSAALNLDSNHFFFAKVGKIRWYHLILLLGLRLEQNDGQIYSIVLACESFGEIRRARVQIAHDKV